MPGIELEHRIFYIGQRPPHASPLKFYQILYSQWRSAIRDQEDKGYNLFGLVLTPQSITVNNSKQEVKLQFDWHCLHTIDELGQEYLELSSELKRQVQEDTVEIFTETQIRDFSRNTSWSINSSAADYNFVLSVAEITYLDERRYSP